MRFAVVLLVAAAACRPPGYGKEPDVDASMTGSGSGSMTVTPDAGMGSNDATCDHAFRIEGHGSDSSVWLTGTMVNWAGDPGAGAIQFTLGSDGAWTGNYAFPTGTHQYKLIVNGSNWILDPSNPDTVDDGMGHTNNVFTCSPP
jgi:hypothetical protein